MRLCIDSGLAAIEWGGDVHVPHGDLETARKVGAATREAGLEVACYGSYYRIGVSENEGLSFDSVLATAEALEAPSIRVWAGNKGSADTDPSTRSHIVAESRRIAEKAAVAGIVVASEYHGQTLTDELESATEYLRAVQHPNFRSLWQPPSGLDEVKTLETLQNVLPWLQHVHVFHWGPGGWKERFPLADGHEHWKPYFAYLAERGEMTPLAKGKCYALLEFVKDNEPGQLTYDAQALHTILADSRATD